MSVGLLMEDEQGGIEVETQLQEDVYIEKSINLGARTKPQPTPDLVHIWGPKRLLGRS